MSDAPKATDGTPVERTDVPWPMEAYAHDGGILAIYDPMKNKTVSIEIVGMTEGEVARSVVVALKMLEQTEAAPVNRAARWAARAIN